MLLVILGIIILIISTDLMIKGTIILSKKFKISITVLSIIIHGVLTSFPELMISIKAAGINHPELIISDVIGSNIINLILILGFAAIIKPITVKEDHKLSAIFTLISLVLLNGTLFLFGEINEISGLVFIAAFILYIYLTLFKQDKQLNQSSNDKSEEIHTYDIVIPIILIIISLFGVYIGPNIVIQGSLQMSKSFNISNEFIGITIISLGTSLPELVTSIQAQRQNRQEIIIGNIIGSNIFNILLILGVTSLITPIALPIKMIPDIILMNAMMISGIIMGYKGIIGFKTGLSLLFIEMLYLIYIFLFII